jgi:hypothetical protein
MFVVFEITREFVGKPFYQFFGSSFDLFCSYASQADCSIGEFDLFLVLHAVLF